MRNAINAVGMVYVTAWLALSCGSSSTPSAETGGSGGSSHPGTSGSGGSSHPGAGGSGDSTVGRAGGNSGSASGAANASSGGASGSDTGNGGGTAFGGSAGSAGAISSGGDPGSGGSHNPSGGMIVGDPDGSHSWTTIAQATLLGIPDSPGTTVIYLLSKAYPCNATSWKGGSGWDTKVPKDTIMMEIKIAGPVPSTFPATYTVPLTNPNLAAPPAANKAFAIWNVLTAIPPIVETSATGKGLTITALTPSVSVRGSLDLTFTGGHTLSGTFDAQYCAGSGEP